MANIFLGFLVGCFFAAFLAPASEPASSIISFSCVSLGMIIGLLCNRTPIQLDSPPEKPSDPWDEKS